MVGVVFAGPGAFRRACAGQLCVARADAHHLCVARADAHHLCVACGTIHAGVARGGGGPGAGGTRRAPRGSTAQQRDFRFRAAARA
ncbi:MULTISPECIES: hypothetical protein [unclassified Xanthobacter]|uniref:hypothetical protein n=1 Tax=unclassified Xanthobacter TaxID=2623496 RepID=UPI001EE0F7E7|nr:MULTISPECIES: hypothetical protein [unclassified Xanthobacter]